MSRRGPVLPPSRYLWITVLLVLPMGSAAQLWRGAAAHHVPLLPKLAWVGLALFPTFFAFLAYFVLKGLQAMGLELSRPRRRNWLIYYGSFLAAAIAGSILRDELRGLYFHLPPSPLQRAVGTCLMAYLLVWFAYFMESHAVFLREIRAKIDQSMRTIRETFLSQEMLRVAQERKRHELLWAFEDRMPRQLESIKAQVGAMQERMANGCTLEGQGPLLMESIDSVREDSIRKISHLLHPSIVSVGLLPALRSLAKNCSALEVTIAADASTQRLDEVGSQAISPEIRLAVYRIVEQALEHLARGRQVSHAQVSLSHGAGNALSLEIGARGSVLSEAGVLQGLALAVMHSRIALVNGTLAFETLPEERSRLLATIPLRP